MSHKTKKIVVSSVFSITLLGCIWFASPKLRFNVLQFFSSNPEKQFQIAVRYFSAYPDWEVEDFLKISQKAADQGNFSAKVALGDLYNEEIDGDLSWVWEKNNDKAESYYLDALSSTRFAPFLAEVLGTEKKPVVEQAMQIDEEMQ